MGQLFSCFRIEELQESKISENTSQSVSVLGTSSAADDEGTLVPDNSSASFTTARNETFIVRRPSVLHTSTPI